MKPWWQEWAPRLDYEINELEEADIPVEVDKEAFSRGLVVLRLSPVIDGQTFDLIVRFPDLYPYFRFEVSAPTIKLQRHQNPFSQFLCLIGRATEHWDSDYTVAKLIKEHLPLILAAQNTQENSNLEQHQGEPFSDYYSYMADSMVFIDSSWKIDPEFDQGDLTIGIEEHGGILLRGAVLRISAPGGEVLAEADRSLGQLYPKELRFRWVRLNEPLSENHPPRFLEALIDRYKPLQHPWYKSVEHGRIDVIGVLFPEEVRWRESADGWVFLVRMQQRGKKGYQREKAYLARPGRAGIEDLMARIPELASLRTIKVAQIGLGGIGAPAALEFARCGVGELRLLDHDYLDPGTAVRWPLGMTQAGFGKAEVIKNFISANWPYTKVVTYQHKIGGVREDGPSDIEVLSQFLTDVDLIYDASAEVGVHHLISDIAFRQSIPYVVSSTAAGAWGGFIARIIPGKTEGCWKCLQYARQDGTIPNPPHNPEGEMQPIGCADPTFTGSSFDIQQITIGAVRMAIATLTHGLNGAYPSVDWDVALISLRGVDGRAIPTRWETFVLHKHPSCQCGKN